MWNDIQIVLSEWLARFKTCGTYLWSKAVNGYVDVGATFSREWGSEKGFGLMLDLTSDKTSGEPAILSNIWVAAA